MIAILQVAGAVILWSAIHSWLATTAVKQALYSMLGKRLFRVYRLVYNLFAVASFAPIVLLLRGLPDRLLYTVPTPWLYLILAAEALFALLLLLALLQTGPMHFAGLRQLLGGERRASLTTTGFYRLVRHPLYLFGLAILWLTPVMTLNQLTAYAVLSAYLFLGALLEERRLVREFGGEYLEYRRRTPMIIPWPRRI